MSAVAEVAGLAPDQSYHDETVGQVDALQLQERYGKERAKRLRPEGVSQYIDLSISDKFKRYDEDPWLDPAQPTSNTAQRFGGSKCKVLILGAGFGGLVYAVRLIEGGMNARDILLVDSAGGFGGTWYWNRYPGLMCDVESYIYMPLLEEMGYMPQHKYAYGPELREYTNLVAKRWGLQDKAIFQTQAREAKWNEGRKEWIVHMQEIRPGEEPVNFEIHSDFLISASGLLNFPKLPDLQGLDKFHGHSFHTSRWDYTYTGGSPKDPSLVNLSDKNVAILGTGATAIQAVPHLAKWAKHLYIFQRTPSAVHIRGQRQTDPEWWRQVTHDKGWQRKRNANFNAHVNNVADSQSENLVNDGWSSLNTYCALIGSPLGELNPERVPAYIEKLHTMDLPHTERVRARVDQIVKDKTTAEKLKAWYPSWCKRPCFHDDYLPSFNRPNVTLIDTDGQGVDGLSADGILYKGQEYQVDLVIFSTGYRAPGQGNVANRANLDIKGRDDLTLDAHWAEGTSTLHGVMSRNFPNFFFPGPYQAGVTANQTFVLDQIAQHTAHIILNAINTSGSERIIIEPSAEAEQNWGMQVLMRAAAFAGVAGCTPSYLNLEGEADREKSEAEQMKTAKSVPWGQGIESYLTVIGDWRAQGGLQGLDIKVA